MSATQRTGLTGPVLATQYVEDVNAEAQITVQDLGTGRVWQIDVSGQLEETNTWTPDGCKLLLKSTSQNNTEYSLLSIADLSIQDLPSLGKPIFSPDGHSVAFVDYGDNLTNIYLSNYDGENPDVVTPKSWTQKGLGLF